MMLLKGFRNGGAKSCFSDKARAAGESRSGKFIRVDATSIPVGPAPVAVSEQFFVSRAGVIPASTNQITGAYALSGFGSSGVQSGSYPACTSLTTSSGPAFLLRFSENFATALKSQGGSANSTLGSGFTANTETRYYKRPAR